MIVRKIVIVGLQVLPFLIPRFAVAIPVPSGLDKCPTLSACLSLLDKIVPTTDDGEGSNSEILARDLARFGEPAKQELLKRAAGAHPGWRNVAGAILWSWNSWASSDVPALRDALRKNHGSWVAKPLGEIGTPDAIKALVEDLAVASDSENQTGFALAHVGARAIPFLFPLLQTQRSAFVAAAVLKEIGPAALPELGRWKAIALEDNEPMQERIAALRAITALGPLARNRCQELHPLLSNPNRNLAHEAKLALQAVRDPILLGEIVGQCHPRADPFDSLAIDSLVCLRDIASFGDDARKVGSQLTLFLSSANGAERGYGITVLGAIGYSEATPSIRRALEDPDWRVAYSAARSLGWLGAKDALSDLEQISSSHWLPEVREMAKDSAIGIRSAAGHTQAFSAARFVGPQYGWGPGEEPMEIDRWVLHDETTCSTGSWEWQNQRFSLAKDGRLIEKSERKGSRVSFQDGKLTGTNQGEWGGELSWLPNSGKPVTIDKENVLAITRDGGGAVAIFGLAHLGLNYGYAISLTRKPDRTWRISRTMQFFAEPEAVTDLGNRRLAVLNAGKVVVFSPSEGILGLATCR